jgi:hypothetical protein
MNLTDRIKRAAEFDRDREKRLAESIFCKKSFYYAERYRLIVARLSSGERENTRLTPLITALSECVAALENFEENKGYCNFDATDGREEVFNMGTKSLANLDSALKKMEGE